jgi:signal transduction histidine kinase
LTESPVEDALKQKASMKPSLCDMIPHFPKNPGEIKTFEDTGVGIPADKLERIFDVSFTKNPNEISIGLGLSICLAVVKEHEGRIDVTSNAGKGTVFEIILPAYRS